MSAQTIRSFTPTVLYTGVQTPGGATFQAHGRLAVKTVHGCYFTHIHDMVGTTLGQGGIAALWFSANCDAPYTLVANYGPYNGGSAQVVADVSGNVYWGVSNDATNNLYIAKIGCGPSPNCIDILTAANYPGYTSTKWTMMYSECFWGGSLFVASFYPAVNFSIINLSLSTYDHYQVTQNGSISGLEYPFLEHSCSFNQAGGVGGNIAMGWVTTPVSATSPNYDGIHYMLNANNAHRDTWISPVNGAALTLPVTSDDTGPTPEMRTGFTPPSPNSVWMGAFALTNTWNSHVAYSSPNGSSPVTETEQAWHTTTGGTWSRLALHDNQLGGASTSVVGGATLTIQEYQGSSACYFKGDDHALYLMGPSKDIDASNNRWVYVLKSTDDGVTWQDFAKSTNTFSIYALSCMREGIETSATTWANGDEIIGIFTHIATPGHNYPQQVITFHLSIH